MILIIGLPNAGKTTYSQRFKNVAHFDEVRRLPHEELYELYRQAEVIEGVYGTKKDRELITALRTENERKICIWIDTPSDVCQQRENRGRSSYVVTMHAKRFEPPTFDEGWDEIVVVKG